MFDDLSGGPLPPVVLLSDGRWIPFNKTLGYYDTTSPMKSLAAVKAFLAGPSGAAWGNVRTQLFIKSPESHCHVHGIDIEPNQPPLFKDAAERMFVNTWVPPTLVPAKGEFPTISAVLDFLTMRDPKDGEPPGEKQLDPAAREYVVNWSAFKIQNPSAVPKVALAFSTSDGAGKGFLWRVLAEILGMANCYNVRPAQFEGRFNGPFVGKLLCLGDEVLSSDNIKDVSDYLKILIDGSTLSSENKGQDERSVKSRLAWIFASNSPISMLSVSSKDRRYSIFSNFAPITTQYKNRMDSCFTGETRTVPTPAFKAEIEAFAWHLLHEVKVDRDMAFRVYDNDARKELIRASMPSHEEFVRYVIENGIEELFDTARHRTPLFNFKEGAGMEAVFKYEPAATHCDMTFNCIYQCYVEFCKQTGMRPLRANKFGHALHNAQNGFTKHRPAAKKPGDKRPLWYWVPYVGTGT